MSAVLLEGYGFWRRSQAYSLTVPDAVRRYGKRHISGAARQIVGVFQLARRAQNRRSIDSGQGHNVAQITSP